MPNFTTYLKLTKPFQQEVYDVDVFNSNCDKVDNEYKKINDLLQAHKTQTVIDHPDASVTTPKIADRNVTTPKIADRNVTTEKIAYNSVGTPELKDEVFNSHNADVNAHNPILNAIKAITGMSSYDIAPSKTIASIIPLLGFGGIVAQKLETNGYVKFANGFIIQWGNATSPVTFPIAFSTACLNVVATLQTNGDDGNMSKNRLYVDSISNAKFSIQNPQGSYRYFAVGY